MLKRRNKHNTAGLRASLGVAALFGVFLFAPISALAADQPLGDGVTQVEMMDLVQILTLLVVLILLKWADGDSGITFWRLPGH
jgi:hypothetical protein